jgi:hypothetical protein
VLAATLKRRVAKGSPTLTGRFGLAVEADTCLEADAPGSSISQ